MRVLSSDLRYALPAQLPPGKHPGFSWASYCTGTYAETLRPQHQCSPCHKHAKPADTALQLVTRC